jgi:predicted esterase
LPSAHLNEAFEHVLKIVATEGPFDAVMGFSQGAALAGALIAHQAKHHPEQPPVFRAAVFICGGAPWESAGLEYIASQPDTYPINIPTAHIVGKLDSLYPESMKLYGLCEPSKAAFYDHGSKHMVPFDMKNTEEMTRVIEETVAKAIRG